MCTNMNVEKLKLPLFTIDKNQSLNVQQAQIVNKQNIP